MEKVNQCTYLDSEICNDGDSDADVGDRVSMAKGVFGILSPIWRNSSSPNSLKVLIFKSKVVSVLLYVSSMDSHQINPHQTSSLCEPMPQKHFLHL